MKWTRILLAAISLARELVRYLREHKKLDESTQLTKLGSIKSQVAQARKHKTDLKIVV